MANLHFSYISKSSFVTKDLQILSEKFSVAEFHFGEKPKWHLPIQLLLQLYNVLASMRRTDVFVVKFGGYASIIPTLFSKIFGKKSLVITGGVDCCYYPAFGFGNYTRQPLRWVTEQSYRWASHIVVVHDSLAYDNYTYDKRIPAKQGIYNLTPSLRTPYTVIYNGYDSSYWDMAEDAIRQPTSFCTVALLSHPRDFDRKGINHIFYVAKAFPQIQIHIAGISLEQIKTYTTDLPKNITFYGYKNKEQLKDFYNKHAYYFQLSYSEGFPNALCEAMLCGCVPIGSYVNGIPLIIGDTGYILPQNDSEILHGLMERVLSESDKWEEKSKLARKRIGTEFSIKRRKHDMIEVINQLTTNK